MGKKPAKTIFKINGLEVQATVFRGRVCIAFQLNGNIFERQLASELRSMLHEESDPSIMQKGTNFTMNTRFSKIEEMLEFLVRLGYDCREAPPVI